MNCSTFLARLEGCRRSGRGHIARCPAHDDTHASLSIAVADDRRILFFCHAGCPTEKIVGTLGLSLVNLYPAETHRNGHAEPKTRIAATYDYTDESGTLLHQVVRFDPKGFSQRRPDGWGGYEWNLNGTRHVLYRLPDVIVAVKAGRPVYVPEGEKNVDALRALGLAAMCNAGGAGKWDDSYSAAR